MGRMDMLVLKRAQNKAIMVGDDIRIEYVGFANKQFCFSITNIKQANRTPVLIGKARHETLTIKMGNGSVANIKLLGLDTSYNKPKVRLGIDAPRSIVVDREGVYKRKRLEKDGKRRPKA